MQLSGRDRRQDGAGQGLGVLRLKAVRRTSVLVAAALLFAMPGIPVFADPATGASAVPSTADCGIPASTTETLPNPAGAPAKAGVYDGVPLSAAQVGTAAEIVAVGKQQHITRRGVRIALAVALQESSLDPAVVSGRYVGLFQQKSDPTSGLYTGRDRSTAAGASAMFFEQLVKRVPKYDTDSRADWQVGEVVQESHVGRNVLQWFGVAQALNNALNPAVVMSAPPAVPANTSIGTLVGSAIPGLELAVSAPVTAARTAAAGTAVAATADKVAKVPRGVALKAAPRVAAPTVPDGPTPTATTGATASDGLAAGSESAATSEPSTTTVATGSTTAPSGTDQPASAPQSSTAASDDQAAPAPSGTTTGQQQKGEQATSTDAGAGDTETTGTETSGATTPVSTSAPSTTAPSTTAPSTTAPSTTAPSTTAPSTTTTGSPTATSTPTAPATTVPVTSADGSTPAGPTSTSPSTTAAPSTTPTTTSTTTSSKPTKTSTPTSSAGGSPSSSPPTSSGKPSVPGGITVPTTKPTGHDSPPVVDTPAPPVPTGTRDDPDNGPGAPAASGDSDHGSDDSGDGSDLPDGTPAPLDCSPTTGGGSTTFDPGMIISDGVFYNSTSMSAAEIRSFITKEGAACSGAECLKNIRITSSDLPADRYCSAYQGGTGEDVAAVLAKLSVACHISPQVMLVTLQKESALLTRTDVSASSYNAAYGWHCPDTGPGGSANCDPQYAGFFNQAAGMAKQWSRYRVDPQKYNYHAGQTAHILWNVVESGCGGSDVYIRNTATASLYNYTPYQPDVASLAAYPGVGDNCSTYGNRNFFFLFQKYFGATGGGASSEVAVNGVNVTIPSGAHVAAGAAGKVIKAPNAAVAKGLAAGFAAVGLPYVYGGGTGGGGADQGCARAGGALNSCQGIVGFDCSGLTGYVLSQSGFRIPDNSYGQRGAGTNVPWSAGRPGDIIGYDGHVAVYLGIVDGTPYLLEAPDVGMSVQVRPVYFSNGGQPVDGVLHRYWR